MAIDLAVENAASGKGGPFAAIVVKDDQIIATGTNLVTSQNDPTAHAEVVAIRNACTNLNSYQLQGCAIYCSCEPCPMCFGAVYWARPDKVYYAADKKMAAQAGFDDSFIYEEIQKSETVRSIPFIHIQAPEAQKPFDKWKAIDDRKDY